MNLKSTTKTIDIIVGGDSILYDEAINYDADIYYDGSNILLAASNKLQSLTETAKIFSKTI